TNWEGSSAARPKGDSPLLQRWIGVLQQLLELRLEPVTRQRCVRQSSGHVVVIARIATVGRIAHAIETLALVVRNVGARTIRLARRLDPHVGIDARGGCRARTLADAGAARIAPVALVDAPIDSRSIDARVEVRER